MLAVAAQIPVGMDVEQNLSALAAVLRRVEKHSFVVAPEGCLSGYKPAPNFVELLNCEGTSRAIESARNLAEEAQVHLVVGACIREEGAWFNSSFYMGPRRELVRYDKLNLAHNERASFRSGSRLPVYDIWLHGSPVRIGIQMCREIRYPEQWRSLAAQGAQVIAYVNNAIASKTGSEVWRSHLVSRAAETQRFIVGANNAAPDQLCPTLIVDPSGQVLAEATIGATVAIKADVDLREVSDWVLSQAREDVVSVRTTDTTHHPK